MKENFENENFKKIPSKTSKHNKTIIFLGSKKTGKTSIISQFCKNKFISSYSSTLGVNFYFQTIETDFGTINFNIWDTNGEEITEEILPFEIYLKADAFALCCSYDNKESLNNIRNCIFFIKKFNLNSKPILIVINKNDVENKMFNKNDVDEIINENNLNIANVEINAKFNVDFIFFMFAIAIFNEKKKFNFDVFDNKKNIKIEKKEKNENNNNNNNNNNKKHCC